MNGIIDYAGLFPPADLSLDTAITNYSDYLDSEDAWMLSRFIIPAASLAKLEPYSGELFSDERPFSFSVLGKGTETVSEFREEIEAIIRQCTEFNERQGAGAVTDILEIKLPREAVHSCDTDLIKDLLNETAEKFNDDSGLPGHIFYEGFFEESWKKDTKCFVEAISQHNIENRNKPGDFYYSGYKLRCGGVEAHMFPSTEQIAFALNRAREYDVAVKCTAGLHHPVRHYSESVKTKMHGFFNVFGGAMLAYAHDLSDEEFVRILEEEDTEQFVFGEDSFLWKDYAVFTGEIAELREVALISFGSCSFDEPREDLQKLKLL